MGGKKVEKLAEKADWQPADNFIRFLSRQTVRAPIWKKRALALSFINIAQIFYTDFQVLKESRGKMEENNVKPANEVSILSEKIATTSESNVDLTSMSENDNIIKGKFF